MSSEFSISECINCYFSHFSHHLHRHVLHRFLLLYMSNCRVPHRCCYCSSRIVRRCGPQRDVKTKIVCTVVEVVVEGNCSVGDERYRRSDG